MHVRVPFLKLLEGFALLRFVRYAQDAVQLLDECLALPETYQAKQVLRIVDVFAIGLEFTVG